MLPEKITQNEINVKEQKLCSGFGQHHTARKDAKNPQPYTTITLADIAGMLETPPSLAKVSAQWVIFSDRLTRVHAEQRKKGRFYALWADLDKVEGLSFEDVFSRSGGVIVADFLLYTTKSATKDNPKSRIIIPLLHPVSGEMFVILQTILNNRLEAAGITPDIVNDRAGQVCYLPNKGEFYQSFHTDFSGPFDPEEWGEDIARIEEQQEAEKDAQVARQEESRIKAAAMVAAGTHSPIQAYNEAYSIDLALSIFGYIQRGKRWTSPNSGSGTPGVTITENGRKALSMHGCDSAIGRPNNGAGVMFDAFDLFKYYSHGNDQDAALKAAGEMFRTADGDTLTKANQKEFMRKESEKATLAGFDFANGENPLSQFTLNGESEQMKKQMLDEKAILGQLALLGQWTMLYSKPNAGKTLLVMWMLMVAIKAGVIDGKDVYYINADDTHKGLTYKLGLAEDNGFMMLSPGYKGFKAEMLTPILKKLIEDGKAKGKVIVLDTVKKFTDLMKKDKSSEFGEAIRQFILHGGSVIALAHVNKHKGDDGKVIHAGTSDLVDDCDCAYTLDIVTDDKWEGERVVKFENFKNRGDVALEASYSYDAGEHRTYQERLNSVQCLDKTEVEKAELYRKREKLFLKNKDVIDGIREALEEHGPMNQKDLVKSVKDDFGFGRDRIIKVLKAHNGLNVSSFQFWDFKKSADKNEKLYTLHG